jgi:enolase
MDDGRSVVASVPQGKSTGTHEARVVTAEIAVKNTEKILAPLLIGKDVSAQKEIDEAMARADGTPDKRNIGANAILGVSIAVARAGALSRGVPLWRHISALSDLSARADAMPRLFINVINGGLHAGNNLDFQEYLVIPKAKKVSESIRIGTVIYRALGDYLAKTKGKSALNLGDEGGYAPDFKNNAEPFLVLEKIAKSLKLRQKIDFGMDAAGSDVRDNEKKLASFYKGLKKKYDLFYLEDPFGEEAFDRFTELRATLGKGTFIAGDDLTTTNTTRMRVAHGHGSANAVIIKPNQIGTVSEALQAVRLARTYGWAVVASHRSGETNDDFIADFACGVGADGLKLGAPARGERVAKYNRLLAIESEYAQFIS